MYYVFNFGSIKPEYENKYIKYYFISFSIEEEKLKKTEKAIVINI